MAENNLDLVLLKQGAESKIYLTTFLGRPTVVKERFLKKYRHPRLNETISKERTRMEARALIRCRSAGIHTPTVYFIDATTSSIYMEYVEDSITVKDYIVQTTSQLSQDVDAKAEANTNNKLDSLAKRIGRTLGRLHDIGVIHGDLTTSNMLLRPPYETSNVILIDFGLSYVDASAEDKAVDLYVLERAYSSTHPSIKDVGLFDRLILGEYLKQTKKSADVLRKLEEVRLRGRKRTMVG